MGFQWDFNVIPHRFQLFSTYIWADGGCEKVLPGSASTVAAQMRQLQSSLPEALRQAQISGI